MQMKFRSPFFLSSQRALHKLKGTLYEMGNLGCFLSGFIRRHAGEQACHTHFTDCPFLRKTHRGDVVLTAPPPSSTMVPFFLANQAVYILFFKLVHAFFYFKQMILEKENNFFYSQG